MPFVVVSVGFEGRAHSPSGWGVITNDGQDLPPVSRPLAVEIVDQLGGLVADLAY